MIARRPPARSFFVALALCAMVAPACSDSHEASGGGGGGAGGGVGGGAGGAGGGGAVDAGPPPDPSTCGGCMTICHDVGTACDDVCEDIGSGDCSTFCGPEACGEICEVAAGVCTVCDDPPPDYEEACSLCGFVANPTLCQIGCQPGCASACETYVAPLCEQDICGEVATICETQCPCDDGGVPETDAGTSDAGLSDAG